MNEHIDLTIAGAKIAARNNDAASTAIHGVSAMYNGGQMAQYRVMYFQERYAYLNGGPGTSAFLWNCIVARCGSIPYWRASTFYLYSTKDTLG